MGSGPREEFDNPVVEWIDSRLPIFYHFEQGIRRIPDTKEF